VTDSPLPRRAHSVEVMRRGNLLLLFAAAALAVTTAARLPASWASGNALNHVSGAWMALAEDLAHGLLYRPLLDPAVGYGGTRWFPLAFVAHAGLRVAGLDLVTAGYALSLAVGLLTVVAAYALLRRVSLTPPVAAAFGVLTLGTFATQYALSSVRFDLLPVALGALGLAALARGPSRRALALAAALFVLGFASKPTALTAPAAAFAWLLVRRERRAAATLAGAVAAGGIAVVTITDALSGGRFMEILAATASGGARLRDVLAAPYRLAHHLAVADPAAIALLGAALAAALAGSRHHLRSARRGAASPGLLPVLWLAAALAGALVVFASPGTDANHLAEAEVAAALALGASWRARGTERRIARGLAPVACALGIVVAAGMARADLAGSRLAEARAVAAALPPGVVVSEDPLLPLVAGRRPFVLDPWMLRLAAERDPSLARPLLDGLRRDEFPAVVLLQDVDSAAARGWYARGNLGPAVVAEIAGHYRLAERHGPYHLYLPLHGTGGDSPVAAGPRAGERRRAEPGLGAIPARSKEIPAAALERAAP
jgi:hypothetical protein